MRLYYHPLSSNSRRVLLTAVQLGVAHVVRSPL